MSFFDLDPTASANVMDQARLNPVNPEDMKPGWFAGTWKAPVTGLASAVNDAALLLGDAATPVARTVARPVDTLFGTKTEDWLLGQQQIARDNITAWSPDPRTTGVVGQAVHGIFNIVPEALAGGPEVAAMLQGYKGMQAGLQDGLDPGTAFGKGAIDGISTWVGLKIPMTLAPQLGAAGTIGTGAAGNVVTGMATRGVTGELLRSRGYGEMADQYKVLDSGAIAADLIMGGAFGALAHYGPAAVTAYKDWQAKNDNKLLTSDQQTALFLNAMLHAELDTAPGIPTDPAARAAHAEALNKAMTDLLSDNPVTAPDGVTQANFTDNPTATQTRAEILTTVEEHLGPEWQQLKSELESRGLPGDTTLYNISNRIRTEPIYVGSELGKLMERATKEGLTTEQLLSEIDGLKQRVDIRTANNADKRSGDRVRGYLRAIEVLTKAERVGDLTSQEVALGKWLLDKNPRIANELAVSVVSGDGPVAGDYERVKRLATIVKGNGDPLTVAHEFLHHGERMMPDDVRSEIQKAWKAEVKRVQRSAEAGGDLNLQLFINDVVKANLGMSGADVRLRDMVGQGLVKGDAYQLVNPSEFWAVNASKLVRERANEGWVQKAVQWVKELIEKMKDVFGIKSDAAVIRGLDALLKSDGQLTGDVLADNAPRLNSFSRPTLREDIPNENWLKSKIDYAIQKGRNQYGVPHMSTVTGSFDKPVEVSLRVLSKLPGERGEQTSVREESLKYIRENWEEVSKQPPYIEVAYNGEAWVSEGNHRIMVALEKGLNSMPVEIRYFDGGQLRNGPLSPSRIPSLDESSGPTPLQNTRSNSGVEAAQARLEALRTQQKAAQGGKRLDKKARVAAQDLNNQIVDLERLISDITAQDTQSLVDPAAANLDPYSAEVLVREVPQITIPREDGTMVPAAQALAEADAEIAKVQQDSQGFDAAVACALRG